MPHLRNQLRSRQQPHDDIDTLPSVAHLLDTDGWHVAGLCASEPDPDLWFAEQHTTGPAGEREALGSARSLVAVLLSFDARSAGRV